MNFLQHSVNLCSLSLFYFSFSVILLPFFPVRVQKQAYPLLNNVNLVTFLFLSKQLFVGRGDTVAGLIIMITLRCVVSQTPAALLNLYYIILFSFVHPFAFLLCVLYWFLFQFVYGKRHLKVPNSVHVSAFINYDQHFLLPLVAIQCFQYCDYSSLLFIALYLRQLHHC